MTYLIMHACANIHQAAWRVLARLVNIRQALLRGLARLADIRQALLQGLARLADIRQRPFLRKKCDSPRQICASNERVTRIWRE
jgi:hypothetical protein